MWLSETIRSNIDIVCDDEKIKLEASQLMPAGMPAGMIMGKILIMDFKRWFQQFNIFNAHMINIF